jgi:hypothetical protein
MDEKTTLQLIEDELNSLQEETQSEDLQESEDTQVDETESDDIDLSFLFDEEDDSDFEIDDYELPSLDPELAENPTLLKRAQEYEKGVKKLINRLKTKEQNLESDDIHALSEWNKILSDPNTALHGLKHLVNHLSQQHGFEPIDLLMDDDIQTQNSQLDIDRLVEQKLQEKLGIYKEDLDSVRKTRQEKELDQNLNKYISNVSTKVHKAIQQSDNGWQITDQMIKEAISNLPNMVNDPVKAVKTYFSDERLAHHQKLSRGNSKAPNLVDNNNVIGYELPQDKTKISAMDIIKLMNIS